jgi:hypothetical protein
VNRAIFRRELKRLLVYMRYGERKKSPMLRRRDAVEPPTAASRSRPSRSSRSRAAPRAGRRLTRGAPR